MMSRFVFNTFDQQVVLNVLIKTLKTEYNRVKMFIGIGAWCETVTIIIVFVYKNTHFRSVQMLSPKYLPSRKMASLSRRSSHPVFSFLGQHKTALIHRLVFAGLFAARRSLY